MDAVDSIRSWNVADAHRLAPVLLRRLGKSEHMREILATYSGEEGGKRLIRAARDLDPNQTADVGGQLRASGIRSLVLWGQDDRYLDINTVARPLADMLSAPLSIDPGGHFTPSDCPNEVSAALSEFLSACTRE
jgi:pimeloyl-ACP methyl ester carboxylesterase